jgi:hypothetical protein
MQTILCGALFDSAALPRDIASSHGNAIVIPDARSQVRREMRRSRKLVMNFFSNEGNEKAAQELARALLPIGRVSPSYAESFRLARRRRWAAARDTPKKDLCEARWLHRFLNIRKLHRTRVIDLAK